MLAGRHRYPVPVLAVSAAPWSRLLPLGYVNGAAVLLPAVALYTVATDAVACAGPSAAAAITLPC